MAGFTTQKGGFTYVTDLFLSICQDMVANGYALKFPATLPVVGTAGAPTALFKATLEVVETNVDAAKMPWRIQFDASVGQIGNIYVATPVQLANDGSVAVIAPPQNAQYAAYPVGMINTMYAMPDTNAMSQESYDGSAYNFIWRNGKAKTALGAAAFPLSYRLSVTDRGFALAVWEDADNAEATPTVSWIAVQRPVDNANGQVFVTGHAPVFCVFGMSGRTSKFVVREADVFKPSPAVPADSNTEDSRAILNTSNQVSITEDNRYVITFPNGLNTPRYSYTQELDMIAYTSADVVSEYTNVPLTVYGESTQRTYKALPSLHGMSTGMRLLFLVQGGGAAAAV